MQNTETKTNNSVKSKLVAAIAMLLVATIMVVSSTYAWFTLSTKPEVKGIATAVGANGALEIALANYESGVFKQYSGDVSGKSETERNIYWGNLINLSNNATYGTNLIKLFPSALILNNGKLKLAAPLSTPEYGADGRVNGIKANTNFGAFDKVKGQFFESTNGYGFRAIGVTSGMTTRQKAHRDAVSALTTARYNAQLKASKSLSDNGTTLGGIAINKGLNGDKANFSNTDIAAIESMITGLEKSLLDIEEAYIQAIYAFIQSGISGLKDNDATLAADAVKNAIAGLTEPALNAKLNAALSAFSGDQLTAVKAKLKGYETYTRAVTALTEAKELLAGIDRTDDTYTWTDISSALNKLVNVDVIKVNEYSASEVTSKKNELMEAAMGEKGITVYIPTDGGIYADIADLCGDYDVAIKLDLKAAFGVDFQPDARMATQSTVDPYYFSNILTTVNVTPSSDGGEIRPMTEFYGYAIDLAFRTNASNSNLLLQTEAADRIYGDNNNAETMGSGSTMTFESSHASFTEAKVKSLMKNIRVVFYATGGEDGFATILAEARLDLDDKSVVSDTNGVTAPLKIYADGAFKTGTDAAITSLQPNDATYITALVYLDGETIENSDVAAQVASSMTGSLNLQFASSSALVPMDYADLHQVTEKNDGGNAQG